MHKNKNEITGETIQTKPSYTYSQIFDQIDWSKQKDNSKIVKNIIKEEADNGNINKKTD